MGAAEVVKKISNDPLPMSLFETTSLSKMKQWNMALTSDNSVLSLVSRMGNVEDEWEVCFLPPLPSLVKTTAKDRGRYSDG